MISNALCLAISTSPLQTAVHGKCCASPADRTSALLSFQQTCLRKAPRVESSTLDKLFFLSCPACAAYCADSVTSTTHVTVHTSPYEGGGGLEGWMGAAGGRGDHDLPYQDWVLGLSYWGEGSCTMHFWRLGPHIPATIADLSSASLCPACVPGIPCVHASNLLDHGRRFIRDLWRLHGSARSMA